MRIWGCNDSGPVVNLKKEFTAPNKRWNPLHAMSSFGLEDQPFRSSHKETMIASAFDTCHHLIIYMTAHNVIPKKSGHGKEVIAQDVHDAVLSFFCGAELPRFVTSTSLVLIPKVSNPQDFSQFRPISLYNFFNKLLSRILADRLAGILPKHISPQQIGFVKGRNITKNYLLAQEVVSGIGKKVRGGNFVLKLDCLKLMTGYHGCISLESYETGFLGILTSIWVPPVTHLAFADDVLIFANGSASSLKDIMQVLEGYQQCSSQLINVQKSGCKSSYFGEVCQAILQRILSWKSKLLSSGGKIVLIKHVLSAIPVHLLSAAVLPRSVFGILEKACSNFLWGSSPDETKLHWIKWSQLCYPVKEGRVGFRRLEDVYTAFSCKLWWSFRTGTSVWAEFLRAKYCRGIHPCQAQLTLTASPV
ncbi:uncharacterized protein LOC113774169 [Coffea eugenioides]|uniref:uncharacterized protein LOC113774169 n=1 Tax=Coffea eugenioides TaxID=49369 RepID=UPI000F610D6A|nr:uncharacterized protein LOC113774169 [Coffea eugenioides]